MEPIYSYTYGIPYAIVVLILIFFSTFEKHKRIGKVSVFLILTVLLVFFGLRGFVQTDWNLYYWLYLRVPSFLDSGIYSESRIEPGYLFVTQIFRTFTKDYFVWVFLNTLIDILAFSVIFKRYSRSLAWSWVFFMCFTGLVVEINLFRNVKAIILFLLSLPYLQERKFWKFLLIWIAAMMFHTSAALYLPAYFILTKNWGRVLPIFLFIAVNVIFFFKAYPTSFLLHNFVGVDSEFMGKALGYMESSKQEAGITFGYIERTLMFILVYVLYGRLYEQRKSNRIFCNSYYIFYTFWYLFSDVPVFVERVPVLFAYSYWILGPNMMGLAHGKLRRFVNVLVLAFVLIKVMTVTDHILYKYDNVLTGVRSQDERLQDFRRYEASKP